MSEKLGFADSCLYALVLPLIISLGTAAAGITHPQEAGNFARDPGKGLAKLAAQLSQMQMPQMPAIESPEHIKDEMARQLVEGCNLKLEDLGKGPIKSPCAEKAGAAAAKFTGD